MGKLFSGMTNPAVSDSSGTGFYRSPADAEKAFAQRINAGATFPSLDAGSMRIQENNIPQFNDQPAQIAAPEPAGEMTQDNPLVGKVNIFQPTFAQAKDTPQALTTKGKALGVLLGAAQGAALGAGKRTFSEGFENAQAFPVEMQHRQAANKLAQQEEIIRQNQIEQQPLIFATEQAKNRAAINESNTQAELNRAHAASFPSLINKREKTKAELDAEAAAAADASGYSKGSREYNHIRFGSTLDEKADKSPTPYGDIRAGFPDTPAGHAAAARSFLATVHPPSDKTPLNNEQKTTVEQTVAHYLGLAKGDPDAAQTLFNQKAGDVLTDHPELAPLVPSIQAGFKRSGRGNRKSSKPALNFANPTQGN